MAFRDESEPEGLDEFVATLPEYKQPESIQQADDEPEGLNEYVALLERAPKRAEYTPEQIRQYREFRVNNPGAAGTDYNPRTKQHDAKTELNPTVNTQSQNNYQPNAPVQPKTQSALSIRAGLEDQKYTPEQINTAEHDRKGIFSEALNAYLNKQTPRKIIAQKGWAGTDKEKTFLDAYQIVSGDKEVNSELEAIEAGKEYARQYSKMTPILRDALLGVDEGRRDLQSLATRIYDGKRADELNRENNQVEMAAHLANQNNDIPDWIETGVRGASRSTWEMGAFAPLGEYGVIAGFGIIRGNQAITEGRDAGLTGGRLATYVGTSALIEGGIAAAFSLNRLGGAEHLITHGVTRSGLKGLLMSFGESLLWELPEENITEILDNVNQKLSGVNPNALTKEALWQTIRDTTVQTTMATGGLVVGSALTSQGRLKKQEEMASRLSETHGFPFDDSLRLIQDAAQKSGSDWKKFAESLGAGIIRESVKTDEGLGEWATKNQDAAERLSNTPNPGRTDFEDAGLVGLSRKERKAFPERLRASIKPSVEGHNPIDLAQEGETITPEGFTPVENMTLNVPGVPVVEGHNPIDVTENTAPVTQNDTQTMETAQDVTNVQTEQRLPETNTTTLGNKRGTAREMSLQVVPEGEKVQAQQRDDGGNGVENKDTPIPIKMMTPAKDYVGKRVSGTYDVGGDRSAEFVGVFGIPNRNTFGEVLAAPITLENDMPQHGRSAGDTIFIDLNERGQLADSRYYRDQSKESGDNTLVVPAGSQTSGRGDGGVKQDKVDTISGEFTYDEFEKHGYQPDEVTRSEWVDLQRSLRRSLGQQEGGDNKNAPFAEYEEYHRDSVRRALEKGEVVDERVLADYPDLAKKYGRNQSGDATEMVEAKNNEQTSNLEEMSAEASKTLGDLNNYIPANIPDIYVEAKKRPDGKWQLFFKGTRNEVFPGELFNSSQESRNYFKAQREKQKQKEVTTNGEVQKETGRKVENQGAETPPVPEVSREQPNSPKLSDSSNSLPIATKETHITTSSGRPFSTRKYAEIAAKHEGGTVEQVQGGWAVRKDTHPLENVSFDDFVKTHMTGTKVLNSPKEVTDEETIKNITDAIHGIAGEGYRVYVVDSKIEVDEVRGGKKGDVWECSGLMFPQNKAIVVFAGNNTVPHHEATHALFDIDRSVRAYGKEGLFTKSERKSLERDYKGIFSDDVKEYGPAEEHVAEDIERIVKSERSYLQKLATWFRKFLGKDFNKVLKNIANGKYNKQKTATEAPQKPTTFEALPQMTRDKFNAAFDGNDPKAMYDFVHPDNRNFRKEFAKRTGRKLPPSWTKTKAIVDEVFAGKKQEESGENIPFTEHANTLEGFDRDNNATQHPMEGETKPVTENRLFTEERHKENLRKLREKMKNLNSGIDPETLMIGAEIAGYHIERGIRTFAAFVKEAKNDLGDVFDKLKPHLLGFWHGGAAHFPDMELEDLNRKEAAAILEAEDAGSNKTQVESKPSIENPSTPAKLKEQKKYLLSELDKAIADTTWDGEIDSNTPKITIVVPGDGKISLYATKEILSNYKKNVQKMFPTGPMPSGIPSVGSVSEKNAPKLGKPTQDIAQKLAKELAGNATGKNLKDNLFVDGKNLIACDSKALFAFIGLANGNENNAPDYLVTIANNMGDTEFESVDTGMLYQHTKQASVIGKDVDMSIYKNKDGSISIKARGVESEYSFNMEEDSEFIGTVKADRLLDVLSAARAVGVSDIKIGKVKEGQFTFESDSFRAALMTVKNNAEVNSLENETSGLPSKGWHTPVNPGGEMIAEFQSSTLPNGKFIALDRPFSSEVHDEWNAVQVDIPPLKKTFDPDGLLSEKNKNRDSGITSEVNSEFNAKLKMQTLSDMRTFRDFYTKYLQDRGYDSYVRLIDGEEGNRELIIFPDKKNESTSLPFSSDASALMGHYKDRLNEGKGEGAEQVARVESAARNLATQDGEKEVTVKHVSEAMQMFTGTEHANTLAGFEREKKAAENKPVGRHKKYIQDVTEKLKPVLERDIDKETAPNRQLLVAVNLMDGEPPEVREALAKRLWEIAPDAAEMGSGNGKMDDRALFRKTKPETVTPVAKKQETQPVSTEKTKTTKKDSPRFRDVSESLTPANRVRLNEVGRSLFGDDWLVFRDRVLTPDGREVLGKYFNGLAEISTGKGNAESTIHHEAVHRAEDVFLSASDIAKITAIEPDAEKRAEGFVAYVRDRSGYVGKMRRFFAKMWRGIRALVGFTDKREALLKLYDDLLDGKFKKIEQNRKFARIGAEAMYRGSRFDTPEFRQWFGDSKVVDENGKPLVVYHGTASEFTQFKNSMLGSHTGTLDAKEGHYFVDNPEVANDYALISKRNRPKKEAEELERLIKEDKETTDIYLKEHRKYYDKYGIPYEKTNLEKIGGDQRKEYDNVKKLSESSVAVTKKRIDLEFSDVLDYTVQDGEVYSVNKGSLVVPVFLSIKNPLIHDKNISPDVTNFDIIKKAKEEGRDGVIIKNTFETGSDFIPAHDVYIAFDPSQIKSATGNNGKYDPNNPDIRYRGNERGDMETTREAKYESSAVMSPGTNILYFEHEKARSEAYAAALRVLGKSNGLNYTPTMEEIQDAWRAARRATDKYLKSKQSSGHLTRDDAADRYSVADVALRDAAGKYGVDLADYEFGGWNGKEPIPVGDYEKARNDETMDKTGIRYREDDWADTQKQVVDWLKNFWDSRPSKNKDRNAKPELSKAEILTSQIFHYKDKVPATGRLYESASQFSDNKYLFSDEIFGLDGSDLAFVASFSNEQNEDFKPVEDYLFQRDVDAEGYLVVEQGENDFRLINPSGKYVNSFNNQNDAWEAAFMYEKNDLLNSGFKEDQAECVHRVRMINHRQWKQIARTANEIKGKLDDLGMDHPKLDEGKDLFDALREMGDRRGHYMPRLRTGRYVLWATNGESKFMEKFDTRTGRQIRSATLKGQGYSVEFSIDDRPSEEAFLDSNLIAMNDILSKAFDKISGKDENVKLGDFGLDHNYVTYEKKDGTTERHLVITGPERSPYNKIIKQYGGRRYDDKQTDTGKAWHIVEPSKDLMKKLTHAMLLHKYHNVLPTQALANSLTSQVAAIIHSRGSRSRMISRSEATGTDVYQGYERNVLKAITMSGRATAAGTAKRQMAREMMQIMTGTDVSWEAFKADYIKKNGIDENDEEKMEVVRDEYWKFIKDRRIDSATQPNAYNDAMEYSRNMLRNEDSMERVIGVVRGLTALWYLGRISSGLVNLTALAITVPANMKAWGNISFRRGSVLLTKAIGKYFKHYVHRTLGKYQPFEPNSEDEYVFNEISRRGWDQPLSNIEAVKALENKSQWALRRYTDYAMFCFAMTERFNRGATIAASYAGLREQGLSREDAIKKAKEISDYAHGVYGKTNEHALARGNSPTALAFKSFSMFYTFTHNYLLATKKMLGDKKYSSAAWMLLSPLIIGGGDSSVVSTVANTAIYAIMAALGKKPDDPKEEFYRWLEKEFGEKTDYFARTGLAGLLGLNISGSLEINYPKIPTNLKDLFGAPGNFIGDIWTGAGKVMKGDTLKGLEKMAPGMAKGPLRGYREFTEGVTTNSNQPVYYGKDRLKADWTDFMIRLFSFNPAEISIKTEKQWKDREMESKYTQMREDIYDRIRMFKLRGGTKAEWGNILLDIQLYNSRVENSTFKSLNAIKESTIKMIWSKADKPDKREQLRSGERNREKIKTVDITPEDMESSRRGRRSRDRERRR